MTYDHTEQGEEITAITNKYYRLLKGVVQNPDSQCLSTETQNINIWVNIHNRTDRNFYLLESELKTNDPLEGAKKACGLCDLTSIPPSQGQFLKLKGICESGLFNDFDLDFYVHGIKNNRPVFKGMAYSYMEYNETNQHW